MISFRSRTTSKTLNYFFFNEGKRAYVNELARRLNVDVKNLHRALLRLEEEGVLASEFRGKERYFFCNRKNPLYREYRNIFLKTAGFESILKEKLKKLEGLSEAYLFGSYVTRRSTAQSDIDLLLIGKHRPFEAQRILYEVEKETGREIDAVNLSPQELQKRKAAKDQFIQQVFKHKLIRVL